MWKSSVRLGCGIAFRGNCRIGVCQYDPVSQGGEGSPGEVVMMMTVCVRAFGGAMPQPTCLPHGAVLPLLHAARSLLPLPAHPLNGHPHYTTPTLHAYP